MSLVFSAFTLKLTQNEKTTVKNVRSVVVGGGTLVYGSEYTVNFSTGLMIKAIKD